MGHFMHRLGQLTASAILIILVSPALAERPYTSDTTLERSLDVHDVRADGSDLETMEGVLRVETAQGISAAGAQRIAYRNGIDEVESIEASTIKPDGTEIKVPESEIRTQDEDSDGGTTEFNDTKYKVIVYPAVEVGSRVFYKAITIGRRPIQGSLVMTTCSLPTGIGNLGKYRSTYQPVCRSI
jgi:hypothetical protein